MLVALIIIFAIAFLWGKVLYSDKNTSNNSFSSSNNYHHTHTTIGSETPSSNVSNSSNSHENDNEDDEDFCDLYATVSYSIMDATEEECDLDNLSTRDLRRLKAADEDSEYLDSDYISEHLHSIHNKIIAAIREDLELKSGDPHDGMIEKRHPWGATYWEKDHASHIEMSLADEDEIEYTVDVF